MNCRIVITSAMLLLVAVSANADIDRGLALYGNHCQACHADNVHKRAKLRVKSLDGLDGWVTSWSTHIGLNWSDEDILDVVDYLNSRFYRFPK